VLTISRQSGMCEHVFGPAWSAGPPRGQGRPSTPCPRPRILDVVTGAARSQYVPTGLGHNANAEVRALSRRVCKTVDVCLPWFESRTCHHAKDQVSPGVSAGLAPVGGAVRRPLPQRL
jgi:hypothetical protein